MHTPHMFESYMHTRNRAAWLCAHGMPDSAGLILPLSSPLRLHHSSTTTTYPFPGRCPSLLTYKHPAQQTPLPAATAHMQLPGGCTCAAGALLILRQRQGGEGAQSSEWRRTWPAAGGKGPWEPSWHACGKTCLKQARHEYLRSPLVTSHSVGQSLTDKRTINPQPARLA